MLDHPEPDGRNPGRMADPLASKQVAHLLRPIVRRQHQLASHQRRRPRNAPGIGVKHRNDRKNCRPGRQAEYVGGHFHQRMEHGRPVFVEHALGIACGPAGVAKPDRIALVGLDPAIIGILSADPVGELAVVETDIMFDRRPLRFQALDQRSERLVVKQHPVFGMVGDIGQLVREQPRIDGVQDAAHPDRTIP